MIPKFKAILADSPWQYDSPKAMPTVIKNNGEPAKAVNVEQHYKTMTVDEICALPVGKVLEESAFLFMWVTNPFLADGSGPQVVKSWGFEPKTVITWAKVQQDAQTPSMKTGHWFRSASEHIIFGTRGKVKRPEQFPALPTWQRHGRLPHSVKPDLFYEYVEQVAPGGPWLEMFARRRRAGWVSWGNQI